jgi:hypothetical protein
MKTILQMLIKEKNLNETFKKSLKENCENGNNERTNARKSKSE